MTRIPGKHLETHVSHACNLRCSNCSHYSNYSLKGNLSPDDAEEWFSGWGRRLQLERFSLLGGEPTINPHLTEILGSARRNFPEARLQLVTNGWFLYQHEALPYALERHRIRLTISIHHDSEEYNAKVAEIKSLLAKWCKQHTLDVQWRHSYAIWRRTYLRQGRDMLPVADNDAAGAWEICASKDCPNLHEGKLWLCPSVAYLPMLAEKFDIDREAWKLWLEYQPLEITCTDAELRAFLHERGPSPLCTLCAAQVCSIRPRSPLTGRVPGRGESDVI